MHKHFQLLLNLPASIHSSASIRISGNTEGEELECCSWGADWSSTETLKYTIALGGGGGGEETFPNLKKRHPR